MECEICEKDKQESEIYGSVHYVVCLDCEESLENKTGYCSLYCRMTGECDESC